MMIRLRPSFVLRLSSCRYTSTFVVSESDPSSLAAWKAARPFKAMPGPKAYPFVGGMIPCVVRDNGKPLEDHFFTTWHKEFGPVVRVANPSYFGGSFVQATDPKLLRLIARNETKVQYPSRNITMEETMAWIHNKMKVPAFMFFAKGKEWKTLRSAMSKPITPRRVSMFSPQLYDAGNELGNYWLEKRDRNNVVADIREDLQKWALKGVTWFMFNKDLSVFRDDDKESLEFARAGVNFIDSVSAITRALPLYKIYPTPAYKKYASAVLNMHALGEKMMQSRFEQLQKLVQEGEGIEEGRISVMEHLLIEGKISKEQAISQACDLLAAGVDTTSSTAAFLLHYLAKEPEIQQALFEEISSICGLTGTPDFADLQKLTLVRNCVKETLRLCPAVAVVLRAPENDMVIHGYQVPKNMAVMFSFVVMGKDPEMYPNPETFDPYRWNKKEQDEDFSFSNLPFGFGVRMCYGRRLAELELYLLLVNLIRRFVLSTDQHSIPAVQVTIVKPTVPVRLQINER